MSARTRPPLLLIAPDEDRVRCLGLGEQLAGHWCTGSFPGVEVRSRRPQDLDGCQAVIVVEAAGAHHPPGMLGALALEAEERHLPVVVLGDGTERPVPMHALVRMPGDTPPAVLAPFLCGLLERNRRVLELAGERELDRRLMGNVHEQIDLIDEELQSASIVQREFLTGSMPSLGTVSVSAMWRPSSYVSGDFYQAVQLDDRHLGVLLMDAAGHGVGSALMTIAMARAFVPVTGEGVVDPGRVLDVLNRSLLQLPGGRHRFATGVYVIVDCEQGRLRYASAGHPPPLRLGRSALDPLDTTDAGPALGIFDDHDYQVMEDRLEPGERLLVHTDGFEQAFAGPGATVAELQGQNANYLEVFRTLGEVERGEDLVGRLEALVDRGRGSLRPPDDLSLVCVTRG